MLEGRFYHLTRLSLDQVLPKLLARTLQRGKRAVLRCPSPEQVQYWQEKLWLYPDVFLPHGSGEDRFAKDQPIWITHHEERPNGAQYEFLLGGFECKARGQELSAILFEHKDQEAVAKARAQWKALERESWTLSYWQQNDQGAWQQKT